MLAAIHQPHYLPWLRYFEKLARADVFIVLDDVQYEKNGFQNRNRIKTAQGWTYLTVPVQKPTQVPIREIRLDDRSGWREKHRRSLEMSYGKAPYFREYWPAFADLYDQPWETLGSLNSAMLEVTVRCLGITTRLEWSSRLNVAGESTERLANLCRAVGADEYLSGAYAVAAYLDPAVLRDHGIRLAFQEWEAPEYPQLYPATGFVPDLAMLDMLFNVGPDTLERLMSAGGVTYPEGGTG